MKTFTLYFNWLTRANGPLKSQVSRERGSYDILGIVKA